jgi:hypothetical protein
MAELAVDSRLLWRSTWPISVSGTPASAIWQAAVCRSRCAPISGRPARTQARQTMQEIPSRFRRPSGAVARPRSSA